MIRQQKTYIVECDRCGKEVTYSRTSYESRLPDGWDTVRTYGHGMTDYSTAEDRCPKCKELS